MAAEMVAAEPRARGRESLTLGLRMARCASTPSTAHVAQRIASRKKNAAQLPSPSSTTAATADVGSGRPLEPIFPICAASRRERDGGEAAGGVLGGAHLAGEGLDEGQPVPPHRRRVRQQIVLLREHHAAADQHRGEQQPHHRARVGDEVQHDPAHQDQRVCAAVR